MSDGINNRFDRVSSEGVVGDDGCRILSDGHLYGYHDKWEQERKKSSEATSSRTEQVIKIRGTNLQDIGTKGSRRRKVVVMMVVVTG